MPLPSRELAKTGFGLIALAVLWSSLGPFGWFLAGFSCLLLAGFASFVRTLSDGGRSDSPSELVTCPSCHARESADRDECRACGEPL